MSAALKRRAVAEWESRVEGALDDGIVLLAIGDGCRFGFCVEDEEKGSHFGSQSSGFMQCGYLCLAPRKLFQWL